VGVLNFIQFIRTSPDSPNRYVPIVMLTGHTDREEVEAARDMGITEFASKPFTAKPLTDRIMRIIENPRSFIITNRYTGPDRRRRDLPPPAAGDRRSADLSVPPAASSASNPAATAPDQEKPSSFLDRFF